MLGVGLTYGAAVVATGALVLLVRKFMAKKRNRRERSMSFGSFALANGVFPDQTKAWKTVINTVIHFTTCPTVASCKKKAEALMFYDRFRSTIKRDASGCVFVDITEHIDVERDIIKTIVVNGDKEVAETIDALCCQDFPEGEHTPLFFFHRIVNEGTGKSALLLRLHHAIGDGISLISAMGRVFEDSEGNPFKLDIAEKMGGGTSAKAKFSLQVLWKFITSTISVITLPLSKYDSPIVFTSPNKQSLLHMNAVRRKTVYFPVMSLEFIKDLKNAAKVTVNDVLMTATAGAIRRYCEMKKDPLFEQKAPILSRALLPVAFPRSNKEINNPAKAMSNYFAMISVPLPMDPTQSSKERLEECAATTRQLKSSPLALIQLLVQNHILSLAPSFMAKQTAQDVFSRHSMVFSNLPGPTHKISFCGDPVEGLQIIFPNLIPQVIIISYAGGVHFNMSLDPDLIDACGELPRLFLEECASMAASYGLPNSEAVMVQQQR